MKNRSEEWQQLCVQDKAERPEPVKSENGGNELKNGFGEWQQLCV